MTKRQFEKKLSTITLSIAVYKLSLAHFDYLRPENTSDLSSQYLIYSKNHSRLIDQCRGQYYLTVMTPKFFKKSIN